MEVNIRVCYIHIDSEEEKKLGYYPPTGTLGTVIKVDDDGDIVVKWDSGTKDDGEWYCSIADVEEVEETN